MEGGQATVDRSTFITTDRVTRRNLTISFLLATISGADTCHRDPTGHDGANPPSNDDKWSHSQSIESI